MNNAYLDMAKKVIPDPQILSVVSAKRARQLALGARPMVKCDSENHLDVALLEIGQGLIGYEFGTPEAEAAEEAVVDAAADTAADVAE
ncbi:MAG: DNA-directed RNA polymerase subunit omega [Lentisphaerae bacterium]|nr:DNA-directed RNA polymerase subunit omega [Lentisphaerota bacterium]